MHLHYQANSSVPYQPRHFVPQEIIRPYHEGKTQNASAYMAQHIDNCRNAALTYFCNYDLNNSNKTIEFRYQDELNLLEKNK